jgi:hypothetical protein
MADAQNEISLAQHEIGQAHAAVTKAVRERRAVGRGSPLTATSDAAVIAAKKALNDAEIKLRHLYENRDDGE